MRIGYADPPYPGQSKRHYGDHRDYAGEVDHFDLIERLEGEYPEGWALSTSSTALQFVLGICPPGVRVAAWVKPFAVFHTNPAYCWEPVIFKGGRKRKGHDRTETTVRDYVAAMPPVFRKQHVDGTHGTKPDDFCFWLFNLMGLRPNDELHDLFHGSGAVSRAWRTWTGRRPVEVNEQASLAV